MPRFKPTEAPLLLREAREDSGLTQQELADRTGIAQPNLAAIESGRRPVSEEILERLLKAADYRPASALDLHRVQLLAEAPKYGIKSVKVFGSVSRGEDHYDSDIDLIADADPRDVLRAFGYAELVESLTGFPVDFYIESSAAVSDLGRTALAQAIPL